MQRFGRVLQTQLQMVPAFLRHAVVGAAVVGVPAGMVGLVVGLCAYWPTAWAASAELGVPGSLAGAVLGVMVGSWASVWRSARDS